MDKSNERSRINKFNKRRRTTKMISILLVVGSVLALLLISILLFSNKDEDLTGDLKQEGKPTTDGNSNEKDLIIKEPTTEDGELDLEDKETSGEGQADENSHNEDLVTEQVQSEDENVLEAYKADWQPIGTSQSEPHTVDYSANSKDRDEMTKAIQVATGLSDMTIWWIGNDGEQKVVSTVSDIDNLRAYRVYLSWETNRGWQPTLVEVLKENDRP